MDIAIEAFKNYGFGALGWIIALPLGYYLANKLIKNVDNLTGNVTELTKQVALIIQRQDHTEDDIIELKAKVGQPVVKYRK